MAMIKPNLLPQGYYFSLAASSLCSVTYSEMSLSLPRQGLHAGKPRADWLGPGEFLQHENAQVKLRRQGLCGETLSSRLRARIF